MAMASAIPGSPKWTDQDDGQRAVDDDRPDRGPDRSDRVLAGIERPGEDGDHRVRRQPDEERGQGHRDDVEVGWADPAAAEQDLDDRLASHSGEDRDRDHDVDQQPQPTGQEVGEGRFATDGGVARQRREQHDPERHADDPERDLEQGEGKVEVGNGAGPDERLRGTSPR